MSANKFFSNGIIVNVCDNPFVVKAIGSTEKSLSLINNKRIGNLTIKIIAIRIVCSRVSVKSYVLLGARSAPRVIYEMN